MHIADDLVILEPADADGNIVPFGQPADRDAVDQPVDWHSR